ncbi:cytochrome P450 [Cokeromyces recurvatus]|uniref:cytochrome P450 n=1 Tax=Cokeromyces recurvatus TaxID=90255 RepID=UPI00221FD0D8|nr:cytochrome P450 [Cokeromyces recurvatus]KAI7907546.1 cytochrome P450 [Cokeromyces recurvatus]
MVFDNTTSLIIALKGSTNIEDEGRIIRFGNGANLDTIRGLAAEKLSIVSGIADIQFLDVNERLIDSIDSLRNQQVVYIDMKQQIKEIIPGPACLPFVGSLYELLPNITEGWDRQFKAYGPLVEVNILGRKVVGTNHPDIAEIFAKESEYFTKKVTNSGLMEIKAFGGQGLFTSDTDEMDWKLAHKLLMPAFSPRAVKVYQKEMGIITQQTIKIFEQYTPDEPVEILDWTTNLTFETIGRIGFGYNFNILSKRDQPPNEFIEAMGYCLKQAIQRMQQAQFMKRLPLEANRKFDRAVKLMHDTVDTVIAERKKSPDAGNMDKDLLGYMLNARDEHNLGLSDENIRDQVVTFLIAGHDTTANTLAWTLYELSRHPDIQAKVLQEIADNHITWDTLPTSEQISNLKYMHQVIKEVLRLYPPVRFLGKFCKQDCIVPGGYKIKANTSCSISVYSLHHNEAVYPNHNHFDPDRWTSEEEQKRSRFAWLPFSTGPRGCIGMAFALQEAKTVLAMLLNRFEFRYDGPDVQYDPKMATTKPVDLKMTIHPRENFPEPGAQTVPPSASSSSAGMEDKKADLPAFPTASTSNVDLPPVTFLFGTQTGTAQDYANLLATQAKNFGFKKVTLCEMDNWKVLQDGKFISNDQKKRSDQELVIICTATYNGQPPDSAEKFNKFLDEKLMLDNHEHLLKGLSFAVFGLGNKNWQTYQAFPIKVINFLEELGADQFFTSGEGNADKDMDSVFNEWCAHFWTHTLDAYGLIASETNSVVPTAASTVSSQKTAVKVKFIQPNEKDAWKDAKNNYYGEPKAVFQVNHELQAENSPRSTRHVEIDISKLKSSVDDKEGQVLYQAGDHLEIMPENDPSAVETLALRFNWILDSVFEIDQESISDVSPRSLAANIKGPCTIRNMLTYYADITSPPSRAVLGCFSAQLKLVAPDTASTFEKLLMPDTNNRDLYPDFIKQYRTLLDLQAAYPQVNQLDLGQFLAAVQVIQPRRYSISSSPLAYPHSAHLTVGIVDDVVNEKHYYGLASHFIKCSTKGLQLRANLKSSKNTFSLPNDPKVPLILIAAGTGLAPFRGFLQERKAQLERGEEIGKVVLFFGCRRKDQDFIYQEELEEYIKSGVLTKLHVAFSRSIEVSPKKYVQHEILSNATEVWNMLYPDDDEKSLPAAVYVCGSGAMSRDVRRTFCTMATFFGMASNNEEADKVINQLTNEKRYLCDVWG